MHQVSDNPKPQAKIAKLQLRVVTLWDSYHKDAIDTC